MPWRSATRQLTLPPVLTAGELCTRTLQDIFCFVTHARPINKKASRQKAVRVLRRYLHSRDYSRLVVLSWYQGDPVAVSDGSDLEGGQHRCDGNPHR